MKFEFATAPRLLFGPGVSQEIPGLGEAWGKRVLVVTGRKPERHEVLFQALRSSGYEVQLLQISAEPTLADARAGVHLAREGCVNWVLGVGGGSVVDAGKAISALAPQEGDVLDYIEVVGKAQPLVQTPLPYVAVPTTAGTGAEVTRNAVLTCPESGVKASLRSFQMLPRVAVVDPALALSCPTEVTAASGMDALTQCIEAYLSSKAQPMTDALTLEGVRLARRALVPACERGDDLRAREELALAALYSGMGLANAGLGAVHGFAAPLGGRYGAAHGKVCAALLPAVWLVNFQVAQKRNDEATLEKMQLVADCIADHRGASIEGAGVILKEMAKTLRIPRLSEMGVDLGDLDWIVKAASQASSMKGNPVPLEKSDLIQILELSEA